MENNKCSISEIPYGYWFTIEGHDNLWEICNKGETITTISDAGHGGIKEVPSDTIVEIRAIDTKGEATSEVWRETALNMQQLAEDGPWGNSEDRELPRIDIPVFGQVLKEAVTTTDSSGKQEIHNLPIGGKMTLYKEHYDTLEEILFDINANLIPLTIEKLQNMIKSGAYIEKDGTK